jgi:hypothetical protein
MSRLIPLFLFASALFAAVHLIATAGSLYWYYWWLDLFMHFWGGILIGLGVHALSKLKSVPISPTLLVTIVVLITTVIAWELFEWFTGLYNPISYMMDTIQDLSLGLGGGLLAHFTLSHLYNRKI